MIKQSIKNSNDGKEKEGKAIESLCLSGVCQSNYFCDRIVETEELIANLQNGRNTVLISPRRIGKTGLIKNAFYQL